VGWIPLADAVARHRRDERQALVDRDRQQPLRFLDAAELSQAFISIGFGRWLARRDSNWAALRSASTLRNQLINGFQLALFWSTNLSNSHRRASTAGQSPRID